MVALAQGTKAPLFNLRGVAGGSHNLEVTLRDNSVVLLAFLKVSCPVCHLEFPYLERLHRSYRTVPIWGVSQDDADATVAFGRMFGCTFPLILDETLETTVAYDLTTVPSVFLVSADQVIRRTIEGFCKADLEELNQELARYAKQPVIPLFTSADEVPELKPGCASKRPL